MCLHVYKQIPFFKSTVVFIDETHEIVNVRDLDIYRTQKFLFMLVLSVMFRHTKIAEKYGFNECHL